MGNPGFFHVTVLYGVFGELGYYAGDLDDLESAAGTGGARVLYHWMMRFI